MNKIDYMVLVAKNVHDMKQLQINYKYLYDKNERQEMFKIARKISRFNKVDIAESRTPIDEKNLYNNFFNSLGALDSDIILNYFKDHLDKITLVRSKKVLGDDAELEYDICKKQPTKFYLNLPKTRLTITNQIGFAHEMGHIPEIDIPRHSYMEYNEVLPMFFEYITALNCYNPKEAKEKFIYERLSMIIDDAVSLTRLYKRCELKEEVQKLYFTQEFADTYKFLESFDYTLQLIDLYEKDKESVIREIENIINGKSLIDVSEDLYINPSECKRLLKEYKEN